MTWKTKRAKLRSPDWILSALRNNQSFGAESVLDLSWVSGRLTWYDGRQKTGTRKTTENLEMKDVSKVIEHRINSALPLIRCGAHRRGIRKQCQ